MRVIARRNLQFEFAYSEHHGIITYIARFFYSEMQNISNFLLVCNRNHAAIAAISAAIFVQFVYLQNSNQFLHIESGFIEQIILVTKTAVFYFLTRT